MEQSPMIGCPAQSRLDAFARGACSEEEATTVRLHLGECDGCRDWITESRGNERLLGELRGVVGERETAPPPGPGAMVGPYRIVRRLGAGGMGVVYEARRESPKGRVALKVLSAGMASAMSQRRFEHEAEILRRLNHPGIAGLHEAGSVETDHGAQPWLAMELIEGRPLLEHAADLDRRTRLRLFVRVCQAVHHAHVKGVIHRDIKPSNILVDPDGQPKVLDFGVARLTDSDIRSTTLMTDVGQLIGTLPYMSPEQVAGDPTRLDTRADVYALGVLLWELLTGKLPHDLSGRSIPDAIGIIARQPPRRLTSVSRDLRGDLQTIVDKTLEKDPARRYQSAAELAGDVTRFVDHKPIAARPPTLTYQLRAVIGRHRLASAAVFALLLGLTGFAVAMSVMYVRSEASRQRAITAETEARSRAETARAVSASLTELLRTLTTVGDREDEPFQREVLDRTTATLDVLLAEQPESRADMLMVAAGVYSRHGITARAAELVATAVQLREATFGAEHEQVAAANHQLAIHLRALRRFDEAGAAAHAALAVNEKLFGATDRRSVESLCVVGSILVRRQARDEQPALRTRLLALADADIDAYERGRLLSMHAASSEFDRQFDAAAESFGLAATSYAEAFGGTHLQVARSNAARGRCLSRAGRPQESVRVLNDAIRMARAAGDRGSMDLANALNGLVNTLRILQRWTEAERHAREAEAIVLSLHGPEHRLRLVKLSTLAGIVTQGGDLHRAEPMYREVLDTCRQTIGPDAYETGRAADALANVLACMGREAEANALYREALAIFRRHRPADDAAVLGMLYELARTHDRNNAGASAWMWEQVAIYERIAATKPAGHIYHAELQLLIGTLAMHEGDLVRADAALRECVELARTNLDPDNWVRAYYEAVLGQALARSGTFEEAEGLLTDSYSALRPQLGPGYQRRLDVHRRVIELYELWGRDDEAARWRETLPLGARAIAP